MAGLSILVADDHRLVADGVRKILEEQPDWRVVAEAADGRDAVRLGTDLRPDVAVIDVSMPNLNGVEAAAQLTERVPDIKILMLSMYLGPGDDWTGASGRGPGIPAKGLRRH